MPWRRTYDSRSFREAYIRELPSLKEVTEAAERLVRSILNPWRRDIHLVCSRLKDTESALEKIREKSYSDPENQLTDKIGVRVITYYAEDVDRVVERLSEEFEVDATRSVDKRLQLNLRAFGYRSVHLIVKLKGHRATSPEYAALAGRWFEIQVRSILEHSWAEIEHEVVYKSGIEYPDDVKRRFAALAAALEQAEIGFAALRRERDRLIDSHKANYEGGGGRGIPIDAARPIALLEVIWPRNEGWRRAEGEGTPFPPRIEVKCVAALKAAGVNTGESLYRTMKSAAFRRMVRRFCGFETLDFSGASHLALVTITVAMRSRRVFEEYFSDMTQYPGVIALFQKRRHS
jgi:ppGpp synthetase/RelA/SpoT-type nucleotidyltranferase